MNEKNKVIGIIAASYSLSYIKPELIEIGIKKLNELGFHVRFSDHAFEMNQNYSSSLKSRLKDLHDFLEDGEIDIIMSAIGGDYSGQLLDYIDYSIVKKNKKKIIGFSDTTALILGIYAQTGVSIYHGPAFITFCNPGIYQETIEYFFEVLYGQKTVCYTPPRQYAADDWFLKKNFGPRDHHHHQGWKCLRKGSSKGKIIGGNLETITKLINTKYFPDFKGKNYILFLESTVNEKEESFKKNFLILKNAKVFDQIRGLIIGQFAFENSYFNSIKFEKFVLGELKDFIYPIISDVCFSHIDPIYTVEIGATISLNTNKNESVIKLIKSGD